MTSTANNDVEPGSIGTWLSTQVVAELRHAEQALGWAGVRRHTGVHEARKAVRRARSALALARAGFPDTWRSLDRALQELNRSLSGLRDAHAVLDTGNHLARRAPGDGQVLWRNAVRVLRAQRNRLLSQVLQADPNLHVCRQRLLALSDQALALPWPDVPLKAVEQALRTTLKRVTRAARDARRRPDAHSRHAVRRRLRRLRMQWNLLRVLTKPAQTPSLARAARAMLRQLRTELPDRATLRQRSDALGREQNLRVLDAALTPLDPVLRKPCRRQLRTTLRTAEQSPAW